ncbi:MAG: HAMP domain-containing histidine kinase [Lachnospiraceae bacterium]|nr:HAMP domain-containing histidine kinase [Lachnospiraceae bacterium]MCM1239887.1 HAMP domain-containing histidine kinase [Lachnospiraceae bacterium]
MDTKWKSIKKALSLLIFFLGMSLTLYNLSGVLRRWDGITSSWASGKLWEEDYQQSWEFQHCITDCLENFFSIAINGSPVGWDYYSWGDTYGYGQNTATITMEGTGIVQAPTWDLGTLENSAVSEDAAQDDRWDFVGNLDLWLEMGGSEEEYEEYMETYEGYMEGYEEYMDALDVLRDSGYWEYGGRYGYDNRLWSVPPEQLTEEQKALLARQKERLTQMYFAGMEEDKNLLYSIYYDGKLLYSNSDQLAADGSMQAPEGYNFLLYFDGEKVRITKDGKEADVYGDGYYRDADHDWYVPGYRNFPVNEEMKKVVICMAAAKEPMLYTTGIDRNSGYQQGDNSLYWMQYYRLQDWKIIRRDLIGLTVGVALLFFSCFCRKDRGEALEKIASAQGKIWVECKVLFLFLFLCEGVREYFVYDSYGYGNLWHEVIYSYDFNMVEAFGVYGGELFSLLWYMPLFWVTLFWTVYFTVNDLKHNKKVWRQGLIAKCCRAYSVKELKLPLARRMVRRNGILFAVILVSGILLMAGMLSIANEYRRYLDLWKVFLVCAFVTGFLLVAVCLVGVKNVKAARDMEALSERIRDICNGDYSGNPSAGSSMAEDGGLTDSDDMAAGSAAYAGHDLGETMAQLENIRQGMASAVDEQMKSERMKVELIANVSHDIKTPLTSIISYVQFLKEEEGLPEHVQDYVKILDEKSQRLKNMVQDVFAVSKAASGELPMNMEKLDFGKLLRQTMADMDEEIQSSSVSFRTELPENPVMIMADGQRMYRVFQNLFQNALKYSLAGSRVYVTLKTDGKLAVASVKNTSHMELDEEKDLTERFVRGDKSRTDGGSGLGLSIAQSFTEACGGQFGMEFNADLFIVNISFKTV